MIDGGRGGLQLASGRGGWGASPVSSPAPGEPSRAGGARTCAANPAFGHWMDIFWTRCPLSASPTIPQLTVRSRFAGATHAPRYVALGLHNKLTPRKHHITKHYRGIALSQIEKRSDSVEPPVSSPQGSIYGTRNGGALHSPYGSKRKERKSHGTRTMLAGRLYPFWS
jgi:hypothetical protein